MARRAIISDIHGNLEALNAVLADIESQGITEIFCLGDVIGYGPNPRECIDEIMQHKVCLLGNHDQGALFDPEGFNTGAERAMSYAMVGHSVEPVPGTSAPLEIVRLEFDCKTDARIREAPRRDQGRPESTGRLFLRG